MHESKIREYLNSNLMSKPRHTLPSSSPGRSKTGLCSGLIRSPFPTAEKEIAEDNPIRLDFETASTSYHCRMITEKRSLI